ncbi:MAG TPA: phosphoglycerate dehydrogenase [Gemmatimonadaceae bacterium]|nr:phosphoglycerate dehydrogenase [Gemmatimonadaceae bacterium]
MTRSTTNGHWRVLIADRISREGLAPLREDARFELVEQPGLKGEELARAIGEADAVIVRSATKIPRDALAHADRLRVIGRAGVGVDTIDVDAATERGIAVLNAPAGNTISAAELTFALLLALVRRVAAADRSMRAGEWERTKFAGTELYGKTLGLVGAGRIGGEVAARARAFGMRVLVFDPYLSEERARALDVELAPLDELLAAADVISVHVPLTESTAGMIGERELALLKATAGIVNAARGGVVREDALLRALAERRIAGAALDVYEQEPLPADHPLRALDNVVLTPHLGASTEEAQQNVALEIAEAVRAALLENDLSRAVNAPAVGSEEMRRLRPLLALAERLGRLGAALAHGPVARMEVRYAGGGDGALRPLAAAAMVGVLCEALGRAAVNFVNALHLAKARGIEVLRTGMSASGDYAELVELRLGWRGGETSVTGALLGEAHPRIVRIEDYEVNVAPRGTLVVVRNRDVPGVIGRVGTLIGEAGTNIAEYHQARREAGGTALAAISVDGRLSPAAVERLRALPEVMDVRQVELD